MNKTERFKVLLEKGYFPAELPPHLVQKNLPDSETAFIANGLHSTIPREHVLRFTHTPVWDVVDVNLRS